MLTNPKTFSDQTQPSMTKAQSRAEWEKGKSRLEIVEGDLVDATINIHELEIQVAELTHSLTFAAGQLSAYMSSEERLHPEDVLKELIEMGKKAHKEDQDA